MHPRLARQLRKLGLEEHAPPDAERWRSFLGRIGALFEEEDQAQRLIDRSMAIASRELGERVDAERRLVQSLETRVGERTQDLEAAIGRLAASEARYKYLFDASPLPMWVFDTRTLAFLAVNEAACRQYGYTQEEFLRMTTGDLRMPEDLPAFLEFMRSRDPAEPFKGEWRHRRKDGTAIWVEVSDHSFMFDGRPARLVLVNDITARKLAESALQASSERLRENEERFRIARAMARMIVIDWDIRRDEITYSDSPEWMRGPLPAGDNRYPYYKDQVHPDDRAYFLEMRQRGIETLEGHSLTFRLVRTDGVVLHIEAYQSFFPGSDGRAARMIAVHHDVTPRKQAEQALRESEQRLRALLDGIPDRAWLKDTSGRYIALNTSEEKALGASAEQILGRTVRDFRPADQAELVMRDDAMVMSQMKTQRVEKLSNVSGMWSEVVKSPIIGTDGRVTGLVCLSRDISERRALELERRHRDLEQRRAFVREIHHRIKNHIQGVAGLLLGHARREPALAATIQGAIAQLQSVAVVHGLQGAAEGAPSLVKLVTAICDVQQRSNPDVVCVDVHKDMDFAVTVAEEEAVPVALIVNELVLNAIKHAKHDSQPSRISVGLRDEAEGVCIVVSNPGTLPQPFNPRIGVLGGSGLRILQSLLPQQGATFHIGMESDSVCARLMLWSPVITRTDLPVDTLRMMSVGRSREGVRE